MHASKLSIGFEKHSIPILHFFQDQDHDQDLKNSGLELSRDQDRGLEDYVSDNSITHLVYTFSEIVVKFIKCNLCY